MMVGHSEARPPQRVLFGGRRGLIACQKRRQPQVGRAFPDSRRRVGRVECCLHHGRRRIPRSTIGEPEPALELLARHGQRAATRPEKARVLHRLVRQLDVDREGALGAVDEGKHRPEREASASAPVLHLAHERPARLGHRARSFDRQNGGAHLVDDHARERMRALQPHRQSARGVLTPARPRHHLRRLHVPHREPGRAAAGQLVHAPCVGANDLWRRQLGRGHSAGQRPSPSGHGRRVGLLGGPVAQLLACLIDDPVVSAAALVSIADLVPWRATLSERTREDSPVEVCAPLGLPGRARAEERLQIGLRVCQHRVAHIELERVAQREGDARQTGGGASDGARLLHPDMHFQRFDDRLPAQQPAVVEAHRERDEDFGGQRRRRRQLFRCERDWLAVHPKDKLKQW
mmetsp:Transcript_28458/g.91886  ORF Transcript_28458/g.91886 Transcript_28458/m.91886 type:complete len:404 (+) Transcript_28458:1392-2603(+)